MGERRALPCVDDAAWFDANPGREYRLRVATDHERTQVAEIHGETGRTVAIVVRRHRSRLSIGYGYGHGDRAQIDALAAWFDAAPALAAEGADLLLRETFRGMAAAAGVSIDEDDAGWLRPAGRMQ